MVLGVSSLLFYAASGLLDFSLLIATLVISYQMSRRVRPGGPKWPLAVGILLVLSSLAYFKYSEFLYDNVNFWLAVIDLPSLPRVGGNILPLGISFYSFQIVAYLVDLYKGRAEQARGFLQYQVFVMFFGQLIAGPIMRASEYMSQLTTMPGARWADLRAGTFLILTGLVKKVVIADFLAREVDARFAAVESLSQADAWIAAYLFAFQIFFDFSGYASIAPGAGAHVRDQPQGELPHALPLPRARRVLGAVAYHPVPVVARLSVHFAGRQPQRKGPGVIKSDDCYGGGRSMARRCMDLCGLGCGSRHVPVCEPVHAYRPAAGNVAATLSLSRPCL